MTAPCGTLQSNWKSIANPRSKEKLPTKLKNSIPKKELSMKNSFRLNSSVVLGLAAVITVSMTSPSFAQESESPPSDVTPGQMAGLKLTKEQANALEGAAEEDPQMTLDESLDVIEDSGGIPNSVKDNPDQVEGYCSNLFLYGEPSGYYHFRQTINEGFGFAELGNIYISTDGENSSTQTLTLSPADPNPFISNGSVFDVGMEATGHTMEGYMYTSEGYFCSTYLPPGRSMYADW